MKGTPAIYLGKIVDKVHFRTNVYGANGQKKMVESWDEFEAAMQSGIWFATRQDAMESVAPIEEEELNVGPGTVRANVKSKSKPKPKPKPKPKAVKVEEVEEEVPQDDLEDDMVYEVKDNEF